MLTGHAQLHCQVRAFLRALQNESGRQSLYRHLPDAVIRIPVSAIGEGAACGLGQQALYTGIIQTEDGQAVERQVVHEIEECLLVVGGIPVVMIHVIGFDVGHDADGGQQMQKGRIAFVGLNNQVLPGTEAGIAASVVENPTDNKSWIFTGLAKNGGQQAGCCRLAVGAGNGDAAPVAHQFRQHLSPRQYRNTGIVCRNQLWIVSGYGTGFNQYFSAFNVGCPMTNVYFNAKTAQPFDHRTVVHIRTGDSITQLRQHLGYAAHTGTTNAQHEDVLAATHAVDFRRIGTTRHEPPPPPHRRRRPQHPAWQVCGRCLR